MPVIVLFLMVLGLVFFALAAVNVPSPPRLSFTAAGLFFWLAAELVLRVPLH